MPRPTLVRAAGAVAAVMLAGPLAATPLTAQLTAGSTLQFSGTTTAVDLGTPGVRLNFDPTVAISRTANTGAFAALNRASGPGLTGSVSPLTVGVGPQPIANLLVVGGYRFALAGMESSAFGAALCYERDPARIAVGQACSPYQSPLFQPSSAYPYSPFGMVNVASGDPDAPIASYVFFGVAGTVTGPGNETQPFYGIFETFLPGPFQYVLAGLEAASAAGPGLAGLPLTARFTVGTPPVGAPVNAAVIPEPGTWALVAAGLAGVGAAARRRRRA